MKRTLYYNKAFLFFCLFILNCSLVQSNDNQLKLDKVIALPGIKGRFDRIAINEDKQIAYIAALGSNTVLAIDLQNGQIIHTITELNQPQGVAYIPENNTLIVTNAGDGKCSQYDAKSYEELQNVPLAYDADQIKYSSSLHKVFVGYGTGGVSIINSDSFSKAGDVKLPAHPSAIQVDEEKQKAYVNVPSSQKIFVIDLNTSAVASEWPTPGTANFPMALDTQHHRLFIVSHSSSKLEIFNTENGTMIGTVNCSNDADDMYYDINKKEIYISCGAGFIDIIKQKDADHYDNLTKIATRPGTRTSLFVPDLNELLVAVPAAQGKDAELRIYSPTQPLAKK